MTDLLLSLSSLNLLPLWLGLLMAIVVIFLIRARQVWTQRHYFGYSVYSADTLRSRLQRWALIGGFVWLVITGSYLWRVVAAPHTEAAAPLTETPAAPSEPFTLDIPRIAIEEVMVIEAPIVENQWDISALTNQVAHLAGTAQLGESGNAVLVGHITIPDAGWGPFQKLESLKPGDKLFIRRGSDEYMYEIFEIRNVPETEVQVTFPTDDTRLTLITCTAWDEQLKTYTGRIVVSALLVRGP